MQRTGAKFIERAEMLRRWITFVPREAILRKLPIMRGHQSIARHFGQHRRGGDGQRARVAFDNRLIFPRAGAIRQAVNQAVLNGSSAPLQIFHSQLHGAPRRLANVDGVNDVSLDNADTEFDNARQFVEERLAQFGCELFGIVELRKVRALKIVRQNDGGSHNRPG